MNDPCWIAAVGDRRGKPRRNAQPALGGRQQHHPAVGADPAAVEGCCDLLGRHGRKQKRLRAIVGRGGNGLVGRIGVNTQILGCINRLRYARQPGSPPW